MQSGALYRGEFIFGDTGTTRTASWMLGSTAGSDPIRAVPELIESEGIHKEGEAVESALVQDGGSDGLFEGSAGSID
ncbi:MAG: hypothetical protein WBX25_04865, partial [Rhodomicrobium sp.]